jgi:hypothetical protein
MMLLLMKHLKMVTLFLLRNGVKCTMKLSVNWNKLIRVHLLVKFSKTV